MSWFTENFRREAPIAEDEVGPRRRKLLLWSMILIVPLGVFSIGAALNAALAAATQASYASGDYDRAATWARSNVGLNPFDLYLPHFNLGTVYSEAELFEDAIPELQTSIDNAPDAAAACLPRANLALTWERLGDREYTDGLWADAATAFGTAEQLWAQQPTDVCYDDDDFAERGEEGEPRTRAKREDAEEKAQQEQQEEQEEGGSGSGGGQGGQQGGGSGGQQGQQGGGSGGQQGQQGGSGDQQGGSGGQQGGGESGGSGGEQGEGTGGQSGDGQGGESEGQGGDGPGGDGGPDGQDGGGTGGGTEAGGDDPSTPPDKPISEMTREERLAELARRAEVGQRDRANWERGPVTTGNKPW
jgi:hypothetical protein